MGDSRAPARCLYNTGGWELSAPIRVEELSSDAQESEANLAERDLRIYFRSQRSGRPELYTATRPDRDSPFSEAEAVTELNSAIYTPSLNVSGDGLSAALSGRSTPTGQVSVRLARRGSVGVPWSLRCSRPQ